MSGPDILTLPLLALKNSVLFPSVVMPLSLGRSKSLAAVEAALATPEKEIVVVAQRDASVETPGWEDLRKVGTRTAIKKVLRPQEGVIEAIVQGLERVEVLTPPLQEDPFWKAPVRPHPVQRAETAEVEALRRELLAQAEKLLTLASPPEAAEISRLVEAQEDPLRLAYLVATVVGLDVAKQQAVLEAKTLVDTLQLVHQHLLSEIEVLEVRRRIAGEARSEISRQQREYVLRQQLQAIQKELGEESPEAAAMRQLRERLAAADLPDEARKEAEREISRLEKTPSTSPEHGLIRTYVDLVIELPWRKGTPAVLDIPRARQVLDEDHYDLKDVKLRILEHLAVLKLNPGAKAPILCFVGPPGVGKTSLGMSIARALERRFERMSLGGLHDEAELRGHRRTYVGAMPGRIIQAIRRAGVNNPLLMLDEVDKLGADFRGDPASALLEVLDPEQNHTFRDNYLDLPFDLSKVFFITTANTLDTVPRPLLDRMEVLHLAGYSLEEKMQIARRYLVPRRLKETGLSADRWRITDEALRQLVMRYTREAGVRQLERLIGRLMRKVALSLAERGEPETTDVRPEDLEPMLGSAPFFIDQARRALPPGVATGLAWTETGGEVIYVEAVLLPEKGLTITGQLGPVMQESAKAAQSYVLSHAHALEIDTALIRDSGVHIHIPAGAIPKDGPSAGITIATALASLYTNRPARSDTAMTGEITLTGLVLPVGGIREKVLAARRADIRRVILPRENRKDLDELPDPVRGQMDLVFVDRVEDVLRAAIPALAGQKAAA